MTTPRRIQRRRTKGWRAADHTTSPLGAVYVGRPTRFGNPARLIHTDHGPRILWGETDIIGGWPANGQSARGYATELYRTWITQPEQAEQLRLFRTLLHGRDLTCWCPLPIDGQPDHCHAAVLLELANQPQPTA
ncbi:MAG: DUF4326 domain-containing protein [Streptomyces sp.]|nr:DUF4326 domain-containing protein [Streptomyces sp.]NUP36165.1 DUF4326 domain-containing protein [Streptomyces sp.]NUS75512.1 DUF4326 domain-containing protein [Streptomyces sp.]